MSTVTGDRYGGEWCREPFREHGLWYHVAEHAKSDLYRDLLPLLNSATVELLDHPRLVAQLCALERRTARGGRDTIDHAPGVQDDLVNAVAGALTLALRQRAWDEADRPEGSYETVAQLEAEERLHRLTAAALARGVPAATLAALTAAFDHDPRRLAAELHDVVYRDTLRGRLERAGLRNPFDEGEEAEPDI